MGAAIRYPEVGDPPRGRETAEPLTSHPGAVVAAIQLLLTMARIMFDLGYFCTRVTLDA